MTEEMIENDSWGGIDPPAHHWEWREIPCKCGYTPERNSNEYEVYMLTMTSETWPIQLHPKKTWRCKVCKELSLIEMVEKK